MQMKRMRALPVLLAGSLVLALLGACAQPPTETPVDATTTAAATGLQLERVVMLMRHGVRPPTRLPVTPEGTNDQPWPAWSVDYGELTHHGYDAIRLLGQWDRANWVARGLLPAAGCPALGDLVVAASYKSRTQATGRALLEGLAPDCDVPVSFPADKHDDVEFHALDTGAVAIDGDEALRAVAALTPAGGMAAEIRARASLYALLNHAMGCDPQRGSACDISQLPAELVSRENDLPDVSAAIKVASTATQTFLLEYLEGMPMENVAWGRLTRDQIESLLTLNTLKFHYEGRAPYVAARAASPLASRMLAAVQHGPKLTVLAGHDTNIAALGGLLNLHWQVPGFPRDNPPPGGALGFEVVADAQGKEFVRAFYRSQTMDQVRELQPLNAANAPSWEYLAIPGCAEQCPLADFERLVQSKLVELLRTRESG